MISIIAVTKQGELICDLRIEELEQKNIIWSWVDFCSPSEEEINLLGNYFKFHHLAIEDCLHRLQRPKLDYYDNYNFFVLHSLKQNTLTVEEIDLFLGGNMIVSFHLQDIQEINVVREQLLSNVKNIWNEGHIYVAYLIIDKIIDNYFPVVHKIEDTLTELDSIAAGSWTRGLVEELFDVRGELLKLRRTVNAMRDLIYRVLNSTHLETIRTRQVYFSDIYDHLLKLSDMIEANRDITSDIRDSYLSISSDRMNTIVTVLTVITTIFAPLTFIAGVYGMNFTYMPELNWRYGYFIILAIMVLTGIVMYLWFKTKGWLDLYK